TSFARDWSSDVCSSDLRQKGLAAAQQGRHDAVLEPSRVLRNQGAVGSRDCAGRSGRAHRESIVDFGRAQGPCLTPAVTSALQLKPRFSSASRIGARCRRPGQIFTHADARLFAIAERGPKFPTVLVGGVKLQVHLGAPERLQARFTARDQEACNAATALTGRHGAAVQPAPVTVVADDQGAHDAVTLYGNEQGFVIPRTCSSKDFAGSIARLRIAKVDLPKLAYLSRVFGPCRSNLHG